LSPKFYPIWTAIALLWSGCVYAPTSAERSASFAPYASARIGDQPVRDFLRDRFAFIAGGKGVVLSWPDPDHRHLVLNGVIGLGSAAAVDRRGYFLTAAHCVAEPGPFYLLEVDRDGKYGFSPLRVVWHGDVKGLDLAIVYAPDSASNVFEWAAKYQPGDPVLAVGLDYGKSPIWTGLAPGYFAGTVIGHSELHEPAVPGEIVFYNAPGHPGDSGGPLVTKDGRLIAITVGDIGTYKFKDTEYRIPFVALKSRAMRPDWSWLRRTIDADAALSAHFH